MGYLYSVQGRFVEAAKQYEKCIAEYPDRDNALFNLALVYYQIGYYSSAISLMKEAARKDNYSAQQWLKEHGSDW